MAWRRYPRWWHGAAAGCAVLVVTLPWTSIAAGVAVFVIGVGYRIVRVRLAG